MRHTGTGKWAGRPGRLARKTVQTSILFLLIPALLTASPQQSTENAPRRDTFAASSENWQAFSGDPAQPTYQGVPAPIPQDQDVDGLQFLLRRLGTTARLMQTVAHPDDEDGGMLTLESRGHGVSVMLMTMNRGEGGQNKVGSNLSDVLGVLRTLELLAADQYYGVEERFSRVADFGFSKSADETFAKWGGHDVALGDMVRVIRTFRPDVLIARFSGTTRDGHGNHQASAILTKEAFRAAGDPKRFPEQLAQGLQPWQAKKLYVGNVCGFGASTCPDANWTVKLNTGRPDEVLGMSPVQFAMKGLRHQLSQGAANWTIDPGDRFTFYKLLDSESPPVLDKDGHEKDFFDGIDTSLPGLTARLGAEESRVPWLRGALKDIAEEVKQATDHGGGDGSGAVKPLFEAAQKLESVTDKLLGSDLSVTNLGELLEVLQEKEQQAEAALNLAMNVTLDATVASPKGPSAGLPPEKEAFSVVSPGQRFEIIARLHNGSKYWLAVQNARLEPGPGWVKEEHAETATIAPGEVYYANFLVQVPQDAEMTRPYWHRNDPNTEAINTIDDERYATLPFPPALLHVSAEYEIAGRRGMHSPAPDFARRPGSKKAPRAEVGGEISSEIWVPFLDEQGARQKRELAFAPEYSVAVEPGTQVIPEKDGGATTVRVGVSCNLTGAPAGTLRLRVPQGWSVEPQEAQVEVRARGEKQDFAFTVHPASLKEGRAEIRAMLEAGGKTYDEGYTLVTREDLGSFYYYQPAAQRVSIVDVRTPKDLKVGYIMGAGDDIPTVLQQVGMDVTLIDPEKLASEDLSRYASIVLGIRAYDTQKNVVANNKKLLDFVAAGGTLVVQYNTGVGDFNSGHFTPYSAELSRERVSVEEAPVEILAPDDPIFQTPNKITARDFDGWVQERGLYFMEKWDDHFKPLLACHDPGEDEQKGGLLVAQYGKGTYIYTGYAFFRQLPAGVPGAVRLYVNLLSAGQH
ncbi:MAG: PIG-L family deacetylase [Candidatus Sulfotelmatobacter sp.]